MNYELETLFVLEVLNVDDDYVNVWYSYDDSCLNYDLLVMWIVKLDSAYGVDLWRNVVGGVLLHLFGGYVVGVRRIVESHLYVHAS